MKENEVLIKVEGLSKKFSKDLKSSLWYGVKDLITAVKGSVEERNLRKNEFWALQDINFELRRGECLGLIGHNGAGKSTLLKILNGLINPDAGKVTIKGRVGALIELGAGFNPILSGRENIYNNGAILGFTKNEIDAKLEDIIDFAEIREFIDMPVQNYSSGMKVRLGFAVAAQMEPDVLLIDEVLAVGDLGFVLKCFKTIDQILPNTAIIFVSHNMPMVSRICSQIMLMEKGVSEFQGVDVGKAIDLYYARFAENENKILFDDGSFEFINVELLNSVLNEKNISKIKWQDDLKFRFHFNVKCDKVNPPKILITLFDKEQRSVAVLKCNNSDDVKIKDDLFEFTVVTSRIELSKGIYTINILLSDMLTNEPIFRMHNLMPFQIIHELDVWPPFYLETYYS